MRTPKDGLLLVTIPVRMMPLIQILPLASHSPISTFTPEGTGAAVSTKHPPRLVLERFPQIGTAELLSCNSTATKHLRRAWRRRSCPHVGVKMSGSNGGLAAGLVSIGTAGAGCVVAAGGAWAAAAALAKGTDLPVPLLMLRMASSRAWSRRSGGVSR